MNLVSRKFGTFLAIAGLFAFLFVHLFGSDSVFGMEVRKDGTMGGCLFDGKAIPAGIFVVLYVVNYM